MLSVGCSKWSINQGTGSIATEKELVDRLRKPIAEDAQNGQPTRPQGAWRLRCTLWGTSQRDMRLRTKLEAVFNSLLVLENFRFRIQHLRRNLRLRIPLIKQQQVAHRDHPDNLARLRDAKMAHA